MDESAEKPTSDPDVVERIVASKQRFLAFLTKRVPPDVADDILQSAFAKAIEKAPEIRDDDRAVAWFYRVLRNAIVDHYRRADARERAAVLSAASDVDIDDEEMTRTICACFEDLMPTLKDEYASMLRAVDLEGHSVVEAAATAGITANNASVRLHRARQALRKRLEATCLACAEHGCLDCTCRAEV